MPPAGSRLHCTGSAILSDHMSFGDRSRRGPGQEQQEQQEADPEVELAQHRMQVARHKRSIQRKAERAAAPNGAKIPESGGAPLAGDIRSRMEPKLGADLS